MQVLLVVHCHFHHNALLHWTARESVNADTLEAGKAVAEAVIMAGKDKIAGRKLACGMYGLLQCMYKSTSLCL